MKTHFIKNLFSVIIFILSGFVITAIASEKEKTFNVSKGDKLAVTVTNGNVTISTWNKDQAYIKVSNIDEDDLNKLKIGQIGNLVVVDFNGQDSDDLLVEVSMPAQFNLDVSSGAGNITTKGKIKGPVGLSTGGGNIKLDDFGDKLSVSTGGGNISAGNIYGEAEISTGGGNISIGNIGAKTDVSTGGGNISIGNIGGNAEVSTAGGIISVGKISGTAELSTAGGNVNLDGASGQVEVNTAGGNIVVKNISGSIAGNTAGGNIYADLIPPTSGYSEFSTAGGDITLIIPSDAKVYISANVNVGKNIPESEANKFIKSDFESNTVEFNKSNFIKRFTINDGGSTIDLNTASGKIKISKK